MTTKRTPISYGHALALALLTLAILLTVWQIVAYAAHGAWLLPYGAS